MTRLVVVGDTLLDIDLTGPAHRLCPDAPAPVVDVTEETARPGGAGLAARLAAEDGADVALVTTLAADADGQRLRAALGELTVVSSTTDAATSVKTRIRSADRSLVRLDRGGSPATQPVVTDEMVAALDDADAVLVADYGRGLAADARLRAAIERFARRRPVVWDPHPRGPAPVPGTWLVTPNQSEARATAELPGSGLGWATEAARRLRRHWQARAVVITQGSGEAVLDQGGAPVTVPAPPVPVLDPCGAGDRFAVTAALGLARGLSTDEAVTAAVGRASEFLAAGGVSALDERQDRPPDDDVRQVIARTRAAGGRVVATGGCFDLLHTGHLRTLHAARALGDCLIVCLNSDDSVRALKGRDRPINHQSDRAELLAGLGCVDAVAIFDEDTPIPLLRRLRPDVWVKGGDYSENDLPEADVVRSWGGQAVVVPYHAGRSTTRLATVLAAIG